MAYDEDLAERVRLYANSFPEFVERKMFGGLCFLFRGNMAFGIIRDELMIRVGSDAWERALREPHVREMDFTGRSMRGLVYVSSEGVSDDDKLFQWLARGKVFASSCAPKSRA